MKKVFFSPDGCLRSGWQMALYMVVYFAVSQAVTMALSMVVNPLLLFLLGGVEGVRAWPGLMALNYILLAVVNLVAAWALAALFVALNKKRGVKLCFGVGGKGLRQLGAGLLAGAASMAVVAAMLYGFGDMRFTGFGFSPMLAVYLVLFITVGITEETLCRGVLQGALAGRVPAAAVVLVPSVLFGLLHFANPGFGLLPCLNIILVGVLFALVTLRSGSLAAAIGYHITWNFFQGNVFGILVSGTDTNAASLISGELTRANIWNGGNFGAEGGLYVTLLLVVSIALAWKFWPKGEAPAKAAAQLPNEA